MRERKVQYTQSGTDHISSDGRVEVQWSKYGDYVPVTNATTLGRYSGVSMVTTYLSPMPLHWGGTVVEVVWIVSVGQEP